MTPEKKSLDRLLHVVRDNPPARPLLGDDEIEKILVDASGARRHSDEHTPNRRFPMGAFAFLMLAAAGTLMLVDGSDPVVEPRNEPAVATAQNRVGGATRMRPDTPSTTTAPAPESSQPTDGRNTGTGTSSKTTIRERRTVPIQNADGTHDLFGAPESRRKRRVPPDGMRQERSTERTNSVADEGRIASEKLTPHKNPMLPYRLTIMISDDLDMRYNPEKDIAGIRYIELTTEELKKLGVQQRDGGIELYGEEKREIREWVRAGKLAGYDTTRPEAIVRFRTVIDSTLSMLEPVPNPTPESYSAVAPIVVECQSISADKHLYRAMAYFNRSPLLSGNGGGLSDEEMDLLAGNPSDSRSLEERTASPSLDRLVAVHVLPEPGQQGRTADVHLWYLPTREFIDLLPDRYRDPLRREVETIAAVQREKLPIGAACERLTGEQTFLDICRTRGGALYDGSLTQNPNLKTITVSYRVHEPRTTSISIHDINGRFVRTLQEPTSVGELNHLTIGIDDISSGTYLVVIRSDKGEQLVQRLIVR